MRIITVSDVEYLAFRLAKEHLSFNEPIPDFSTRFPVNPVKTGEDLIVK